jgi:hypothetical protein
MEAETEDLPSKFLWLLTPTRKIYEKLRHRYGLRITKWGTVWFLTNIVFLIAKPRIHPRGMWWLPCAIMIWLIPFSRIIEIAYAFYNDALDQLAHKKLGSGLAKVDRIRLLGLSYMELSVCYASLYLSLPGKSFAGDISGSSQSLYFSWITITTTGYGDIQPVGVIARALCMSEIGLGLMLLVVAVGTYLSNQD